MWPERRIAGPLLEVVAAKRQRYLDSGVDGGIRHLHANRSREQEKVLNDPRKEPLTVRDEYDIRGILHVVLEPQFPDREGHWTTKDMGSSKRVDLGLRAPNGVWTELPEYWETETYAADGVIRATDWEHKQWIKAALASSKWRWKVQRIRGGAPTDLFTSSNRTLDTGWEEETSVHNPWDISIQSGDSLRLHLEV